MKQNNGFTLIELMIVMVIFTILIGAIFTSLLSLKSRWEEGSSQIGRQEEARKGVDRIAWELRESNPSWQIGNGSYYNISITSSGSTLEFYTPVFDVNNTITELRQVRYLVGGTGNSQLLRREGTDIDVIANNIDASNTNNMFVFNTTDHSIVNMRVPILKNAASFTLSSQANLRNRPIFINETIEVTGITDQ